MLLPVISQQQAKLISAYSSAKQAYSRKTATFMMPRNAIDFYASGGKSIGTATGGALKKRDNTRRSIKTLVKQTPHVLS
jgi:hypothetical protein